MFRFVQQSQLRKAWVPNQLVSASRNSLHAQNSLRFNSAAAVERTAETVGGGANGYGGSGDAGAPLDRAVNKVRSMRRGFKLGKSFPKPPSPESPWYHKVCAFDEYVASSLNAGNETGSAGWAKSQRATMFWDSITKAMNLYRELLLSQELTQARVSRLLSLLHLALKINRSNMTGLNKKPDYDSQSFHKTMTNYLYASFKEISQDVLNGQVTVAHVGAFHLLESFRELLLAEEAVLLWRTATASEKPGLVAPFMHPDPVGIMLPLLHEGGMTFEEVSALYEKCKKGQNPTALHCLTLGMIKVCLSAGANAEAVGLFQEICSLPGNSVSKATLTGIHLAFIGECKDLQLATVFFNRALSGETPYKMNIHVSSVKQLLQNIWDQTEDFEQVFDVWRRASNYYVGLSSQGIFSSLNSKFFEIFFQKYRNDKVAGMQHLMEIITGYNEIRSVDEPFLNIILTKCVVWKDLEIIENIEESYQIYQLSKSIVSCRILLKAMGCVEVSNEQIYSRWLRLVQKADQIGQTYIANADWAALRDATVGYIHQNQKEEHADSPENLATSYPDYNPALEAANASGAFDSDLPFGEHGNAIKKHIIATDDRSELYFRMVKKFGQYCRDSKQLVRITRGITESYPFTKEYSDNFMSMDVSDIQMPKLVNLRSKSQLFASYF
ncbi:AFL029Wp [Eremothecium gossypii ATCC 10895]|uniref:RNA-binding protein RMD9, mitochondrial n=1 Tax=Eremothecium gossypii (strain ATCC 10895 / CBS 109.51 / FGSC 9923 / NRRL Y-1056) TaxID=284811 RepID=RMD9_EREGS|nr:AFL029Wp [Eremothecium gossypii ATCC 10895]Q754V0.1 RecName: Full=RNA-binding protein RMD9, mitochondrial; Flags: Precursor [Eremothecium gossypii ATCC 10895]AAS53343.1 AFL029Wp [Eremothecium gossypii ATCC 10895]